MLKGEGLKNVEWLGDQDPYCKVKVMGAIKKTNTHTGTLLLGRNNINLRSLHTADRRLAFAL